MKIEQDDKFEVSKEIYVSYLSNKREQNNLTLMLVFAFIALVIMCIFWTLNNRVNFQGILKASNNFTFYGNFSIPMILIQSIV